MNSRTSRPRSPTSASTVTAASVPRVIIESSVDLPTPEPAKIPMRWPRPHGMSVSMARTPSGSCVSIMRRESGCGAWCSTETRGRCAQRRSAVDRATETVEHAAEQLGADRNRGRAFGCVRAVAGADAAEIAERHAHQRVVADRDDFGDHRAVVGVDRDRAADRQLHAFDFEIEPEHARDASRHVRAGRVEHRVEQAARLMRPSTSRMRSIAVSRRASMRQPLTSTTQSPGRKRRVADERERSPGREVGGIAERGEIVGVQARDHVALLGCEVERARERVAARVARRG